MDTATIKADTLKSLLKEASIINEKKSLVNAISKKNIADLNTIIVQLQKLQKFSDSYIADLLIAAKCPLLFMVELDRLKLLRIMLDKGVPVNEKYDSFNVTFNFLVSKCHNSNRLQMVKLFLKHGVDIHNKDLMGNTALHIVEGKHDYEVAELLIAAGAEINSLNCSGETPLHNAIYSMKKDEKLIFLLLDHGGMLKPNKPCCNINAHLSPQRLLQTALDHLVYCEIGLDTTDERGDTVLHHAIRTFKMKFAKQLIHRGANVNSVNRNDDIPLHYAFADRRAIATFNNYMGKHVIELCFDYGADTNKEIAYGVTILRYAVYLMNGIFHVNIMEPILKAIAKLELKGSCINEENVNIIQNEDSLRWRYEKYKAELMELKAHKLCKNITLFNVLTDNLHQMLRYIRNSDLTELFETCNYKKKFPFFSVNLTNKYNEAKRQQTLIDKTSMIIAEIFKFTIPLSVISENIVCYLSQYDMRILISEQ